MTWIKAPPLYVALDAAYEDEYDDTHDLEGIVEVKNFNEDVNEKSDDENDGNDIFATQPLNQQGMKLQKCCYFVNYTIFMLVFTLFSRPKYTIFKKNMFFFSQLFVYKNQHLTTI